MQNVDPFRKGSQIEHSVLNACMNPDFLHADANGSQRLPIVRFKSLLDAPQLKASDSARVIGEFFQRTARRSEPDQRLIHAGQYAGISIACQSKLTGWHERIG